MEQEKTAIAKKYRLRAERSQEVINFIAAAGGSIVPKGMEQTEDFPYVKFDFTSALNLQEIMEILKAVDENRIMTSTLQPCDELLIERDYTGEDPDGDVWLDAQMLSTVNMVCSSDFKKLFWPMKRIILDQQKRIEQLEKKLNKMGDGSEK